MGCYTISKVYGQAETQEVLDVIVNVPGIFQVSLYPSVVDFGDVMPSRQRDKSSLAVVKTNYGEQWRLSIRANDDLWYGTTTRLYLDATTSALLLRTTGGDGTHAATTYERVHRAPEASVVRYISTADGTTETFNYPAGTPITFTYRLIVPTRQLPGLYSGVVTYTLDVVP